MSKIEKTKSKVPTPLEYAEVRWWDGFLAVYFKFPFFLANGATGVPLDEYFNPTGTRSCSAMRRALDLFVMSNDILDLNSDIAHGEPLNNVVIAAR